MSLIQRLLKRATGQQFAAKVEAESRRWEIKCCTCGFITNYWEIGGIRYKAYSRGKRIMIRCPGCKKIRWCKVEYVVRA